MTSTPCLRLSFTDSALRVGRHALVMHPSDFAYSFDLRFRHHRLVRPAMRHELITRRVDLERIHALADHLARRLAKLLGAVADDGERFPMHVAQAHIA